MSDILDVLKQMPSRTPRFNAEVIRVLEALDRRLDAFEKMVAEFAALPRETPRLGPQPRTADDIKKTTALLEGLKKSSDDVPPVNRDDVTLTDGSAVTADHKELKENGQQKGYVVLSEAERARGFVRPVRQSYKHIGLAAPKNPLRDLTEEEHAEYDKYGYVKYEEYPADKNSAVVGCYWTQAKLDKVDNGCKSTTTMARSLAETYARDPEFYGGTYCGCCGTHYPVAEFVWDGTDERVGS